MNPLSLDQPWGGGFHPQHRHAFTDSTKLPTLASSEHSWLPRGLGRSYGDVCVNDGGVLLHNFRRDRLLSFNSTTGVLRCEAGAMLGDISLALLPQGWFLPVTPGTRFVTVGGAIANDIHGKNHHRAGSFGCHLHELKLRRSDGVEHTLLPGDALFDATVGGLGLTGLISEATIQLQTVPGPGIEQETRFFRSSNTNHGTQRNKHGNIEQYLAFDAESRDWDYTVGWIDTLDRDLRGVFFRGRHSAGKSAWLTPPTARTMPCNAPHWLLGNWSARAFNAAYYHTQRWQGTQQRSLSLWPFFYPLDGVQAWNRAYGRCGFVQYQFVVPSAAAAATVPHVLTQLREAGVASYLAVIKTFGDVASPGLLSFPMPGTSIALDIPAPGSHERRTLDRLDALIGDVGGRVYPAKDARMSAASFKQFFPQWQQLETMRDPAVSSSFWRRVTA